MTHDEIMERLNELEARVKALTDADRGAQIVKYLQAYNKERGPLPIKVCG